MKKSAKQFTDPFYENLVKGVTNVSFDIMGMMEKDIDREESPSAMGCWKP
jgi:hypothetical protein